MEGNQFSFNLNDEEFDHKKYKTIGKHGSHSGCTRLWLSFYEAWLDIYAASVIVLTHLVTFESFLVVAVSFGSTYFYFYIQSNFSANLSWIVVSFAVMSPMIMQIRQAFRRREHALNLLAESK